MHLVVNGTPAGPLSDGQIDQDECLCRCEYDHCQDCQDCGRRNSGQCDECDSGDCNCGDCECDDYCNCEKDKEGLYSHDKDVLRVFDAYVTTEGSDVLMGAEIELEIPSDIRASVTHEAIQAAFNNAPLFIAKEDGSLNDGIEVVTLPLTLKQHSAVGTALASHWFPVMEKSSRTGMHVHIGKAAFENDEHKERFADFFSGHDGHKDWGLFLDRLFRRPANAYCERGAKGRDMRSMGKYSAVNFGKQYTLEVRGFASVRTLNTYMANLELVLAVKNATAKEEDSTSYSSPRAFMQWVSERSVSYPNLAGRFKLTHAYSGSELFAPWLGEVREEENMPAVNTITVTPGRTHAGNTPLIYGPNTARVEAFLSAISQATPDQLSAAWHAAREAVWDAAWAAARDAAWAAARDAAWHAARAAARNAAWVACALVVEDLITPEQFRILTTGYEAFLPEVASCV